MTIYNDGLTIFREGRIVQTEVNNNTGRFYFDVLGDTPEKTYSVIIERQGKTSCSCQHGTIYPDFLCKHVVAAILILTGLNREWLKM